MFQILLLISFVLGAIRYGYACGAFLFQSLKRNQKARQINTSPQGRHEYPLICQSGLLRHCLQQFCLDNYPAVKLIPVSAWRDRISFSRIKY